MFVGGSTELTEVSGIGIEVVPHHTGVSVGYQTQYRTDTGSPGSVVEDTPVAGVY